ncbi:putative Nop16-like ribosome biogenesis protein [Chloropicon primus]|uniref:Nucleolar protein 16 n=1 Tax=Chloropicon primus TaxID=1764295 RepID=A0A5B8MUZ8_9CHLO|nr:putative Nop16-like ribosome biogenesis protein [Chloropicon primus]UPR03350.1 putative Nop16-like ribosome biogenesis protein [Chloropicon primus]|mmetsp:Transcript_14376/g.40900  ORF Transcript_14376/g.40900 Transcript_14376/m.40900 type:complete len:197 (-) Transcript_14376:1444-2034(-)|eukprot:QDZ24141.1 putative Nop16-like ribosome biogenesis protein [Chloropicon primus]
MARSRKSVRRRTSVKVTRGKKRKVKQTKALAATVPKEVQEKLDLPLSAGAGGVSKTQWNTKRTLKKNYEDNKVAVNVNASIGMDVDEEERTEKPKKATKVDMVPVSVVDEINATLGKQRSTGRRPPKKLTTVQIRVIGRLIEKHGEKNVDAMAKDIKLNKMQHSAGVLKKMLESYFAYPQLINGEGRRDFHSVQKQ